MYDPPPQVGRNALNLQLIADPLSPQGAALADAGVQLYLQGNALRVGALFVWPGMGDDVSGTAFEDLPLQHQFVRCAAARVASHSAQAPALLRCPLARGSRGVQQRGPAGTS